MAPRPPRPAPDGGRSNWRSGGGASPLGSRRFEVSRCSAGIAVGKYHYHRLDLAFRQQIVDNVVRVAGLASIPCPCRLCHATSTAPDTSRWSSSRAGCRHASGGGSRATWNRIRRESTRRAECCPRLALNPAGGSGNAGLSSGPNSMGPPNPPLPAPLPAPWWPGTPAAGGCCAAAPRANQIPDAKPRRSTEVITRLIDLDTP